MPSLQQLDEFSSSFKDIGNESLILTGRHEAVEILPLPEKEPPAPFPDEIGAAVLDTGTGAAPSFDDLNLSSFGTDADFGFGDLVQSTPPPVSDEDGLEELIDNAPDISDTGGFYGTDAADTADLFATDEAPAEAPDSGADVLSGTDDLSEADSGGLGEIPDDLLSGFADTLESGGLPADEAPASPQPSPPPVREEEPAAPDFDLLEFPDIDLSNAVDMGGELQESAGGEDLGTDRPSPPDESAAPDSGGDLDAADIGGALDGFDLGGVDFGESAAADTGEADSGEALEGFDLGGADLGGVDFGGADTGDESPGADAGSEDGGFGDAGDFGSLDAGADTGGALDGFDLGEADFGDAAADTGEADSGEALEGFDLGGADLDGESPGADASSGDFGSFDMGDLGDAAAAGEEFPGPDDGIGFPETPPSGADAGDSFDSFNLGGSDAPLETPDFNAPAGDFGGDNFSLDGFDDTFAPGKPDASIPSASGDVEEISLSESDFRKLQDTLSDYPLNLRLACEELIAEQAVAPDLMSALVKLLVRGAPAKETAGLAGKILGRSIPIPKGYTKQTGEELEEEQASFGYTFVHSFLPVLRLFGAIAIVALSLAYLGFRFVYTPLAAEAVYREGFEQLQNGGYIRANDLFVQAFEIHRVKNWFYRYAEGFRDARQFIYAERKYDELLRVYPRDKKGALDYASLETNYLQNYEKADRIIRNNILDWSLDDRDGLLALAENNLAWGEIDNSRYEEARSAYARLIEKYGRQDLYLEGMLKYFIRTDKLDEVLPLQAYFMDGQKKRKISVPTLVELAGYLLDKKFQAETMARQGINIVPDEYAAGIDGIRDILLRAIKEDGAFPESYYHLARYYSRFGSSGEERLTLEKAVEAFDKAPEENSKRAAARVDTLRMYAEVLIRAREFFNAEEQLVRGVRLYEDARSRQVLKTTGEFGRLYAHLGDLSFFTQDGDMAAALRFYQEAERNGWSSPEIQYRMGAAYYQTEQWEEALNRFFTLVSTAPNNRRLLYALGNTAYLRGDYFAAQGYYNRLMDQLEAGKVRFPNLTPGAGPDETDLSERIMVAENNLGVTLEALTQISGDSRYRSRALGLFAESIRAWDVLTRDPDNMTRMRPIKDLYGPGVNLAFLNAQNILHPEPDYQQQIFMRIDRDMTEPSEWEALVPRNYQLSDNLAPAGYAP
ncbi:MAG: tetratricopeptide repeat protein [Treponema sp.]|jgi:tetratricopeptide (TPR) repeat protein|nr:tetratricopeptide repeat protein [Treponema sp.]